MLALRKYNQITITLFTAGENDIGHLKCETTLVLIILRAIAISLTLHF